MLRRIAFKQVPGKIREEEKTCGKTLVKVSYEKGGFTDGWCIGHYKVEEINTKPFRRPLVVVKPEKKKETHFSQLTCILQTLERSRVHLSCI